MIPPLVVAVAVVAVAGILWKLIISSGENEKGVRRPPGPRGLPLVGYIPFLREDLHRQFTELGQKYGPIYRLRLGNKLATVISSPELVKEVLRDNDTIFSNRDITVASRIVTYDLNDVAWSRYGPLWRNLRKLFNREMLSHANLEASYNLRRDRVRKTVRDIYARNRTLIDLYDVALQVDIDVIINLIWGGRLDDAGRDKILSSLAPVVSDIIDSMTKPNLSDFFPLLARFDLQGIEKETRRLLHKIEEIIEHTIDERIENPFKKSEAEAIEKEKRTDFLQILVDLMLKENNDETFGKTHVKAMLIDNILVAGTDTSATTIEWVLTDLINHPKAMERVQEEIKKVVGMDAIVEESHTMKMDFLDAVVRESLRLHPIGPLLTPRTPSQTVRIGGYTIPKDSAVFLNIFSIQRDPKIWESPTEFRPERFLESAGKFDFHGNNFQYMPFGSGRRVCAGIPLAERMVKYIVATLVHSFDWKLPAGREKLDMADKMGMVLRKRSPLKAVACARLSNPQLYA
ncbi:labd-13Z-ene-9,15,16-triol synthase, chloroplastic-like [Andrographis paniculata]|uniref:labd-13Z-ene-9,15,16-triol synthase, chloroplastic-like n=1 Tax=Andrographis paniculata TaxID=175694 RepID=UPI0021E8A0EF|nr:labd-13Z-ene-9,15,16-triol synthase, chloroplastic-like [Andrographis paniculata]